MPNPIPTASRVMVHERDKGQCLRCTGGRVEIHHRRGRAVKDEHTHCGGNLVSLCAVCHAWVHANPKEAMRLGWIVTREAVDPGTHRLHTTRWGWAVLTCDGRLTLDGGMRGV